MTQGDIHVSIIVPIYKVEPYLNKCIDSIIAQDHKNIDIILIDDGSPDKCPAICDSYQLKDTRIQVIHKKNGGLSDARNAGLELAKGEFVAFVDSDDYVSTNFISTLLTAALKQGADISVCNYKKVYENGKTKENVKNIHSKNFSNIEAMRDIFLPSSVCEVMTWNKLYRKSLFTDNNIKFPFGKIHEDNFTTYKLLYFSSNVTFVNEPLYFYVQRDGSIMNSTFNNKSFDILEAANEASAWVNNHGIALLEEIEAYNLTMHINLVNILVDNKNYEKYHWIKATKWILDNQETINKNLCISYRQKQLAKLLKYGKIPYIIARIIYTKLLLNETSQ